MLHDHLSPLRPPYEELAFIARALSDPHRLTLPDINLDGEKSVDQPAEAAVLSMANASQYLQHLRRAGFVTKRREGKHINYWVGSGPAHDIPASLQSYLSFIHAVLEERLSELPRDKEIVAYCRGPTCVLSEDAYRILKSNGFKVKRLLEGYSDWKAAGLSVIEPA